MKEDFQIGECIYVRPYNCFGVMVKVEWREELKLRANFAIPEAFFYWVEL